MILSGPNFEQKKFLKVSITQYLFLHLLAVRSKRKNDGWVEVRQNDVEEHLEIKSRAFTQLVRSLVDRNFIEKKSKTSTCYRLSDVFEEHISNKDAWLLTCDRYSSWDELASAKNAEVNHIASAKNAETSAKNAEATYIYNKHINSLDDFSFTGTGDGSPITQRTAAPSSPDVTKSTNTRWQKRNEMEQLLLQIVRRKDFENSRKERSGLLNKLVDLVEFLGIEEFTARVNKLMADDFERKHMGKLHYILKKVRGMEQVTMKRVQKIANEREYED